MRLINIIGGFLMVTGWTKPLMGQTTVLSDVIIARIHQLESSKDPKCYATANRLEDFMYGTPLDEHARNLRTEAQKEISFLVRQRASRLAEGIGHKEIQHEDLVKVIDSLLVTGRLNDGDFFVKLEGDQFLRIRKRDLEQYSSVAYAYRSLLSLELDLMFSEESDLLPLDPGAIETLNLFLNISSLAALQLADQVARRGNQTIITREILRNAWLHLLSISRNFTPEDLVYPVLHQDSSGIHRAIMNKVISQKIASYQEYNQLNTSVFLRNIQVFFARQKWPSEAESSNPLRSFFLESLIQFCQGLLEDAMVLKSKGSDPIVRPVDIQSVLYRYLPQSTNYFEDVSFFPGSDQTEETIEAYDLDAFRDGGLHWHILNYALQDSSLHQLILDPAAAEIVVEGIAGMGVVLLRFAGRNSRESGKSVLDIDDLEKGLLEIQRRLDLYQILSKGEERSKTKAKEFTTQSVTSGGFSRLPDNAGIQFRHRSSDWLNRQIRSYVFAKEDNVAKLAIPPAFGGSGVAAEDLNNDGYPDVLLLSGSGNKIYYNTRDGKFKDGTPSSINIWNGALKSYPEPRQPLIADFDNDGWQDLMIIYVNDMHRVYRNLDGYNFEDVSAISRLDGRDLVAGPATVFDFDNDGLLDVFIGYFGNYLKGVLPTLSRTNQNGSPSQLYRNLGGFRFEKVVFTRDSLTDNGWTQAVGHTDIDQDGRQDLIVGNDFGVNRYYLNHPDSGFVERSQKWNTDKPSYTMNVGIGDINHDQFPDLYISNIVVMQKDEKYVSPNEEMTMKFDPEKMARIRTMEANDLFVSNASKGVFQKYELSDEVGRGYSSTGWSWDADFFDFDNDGDEDLYCLNGMNDFRVYSNELETNYYGDAGSKVLFPENEREYNVFFVNENGFLTNYAKELGVHLHSNSRSAAYLDFDLDGDLDILVGNYHDSAVFLQNETGTGNKWFQVRLIGDPEKGVNRDAIGASLILQAEGLKPVWREVHGTTGYLSVHPKTQHFGVGKADKADLRVRWPDGSEAAFRNLETSKIYYIKYPDILLTSLSD